MAFNPDKYLTTFDPNAYLNSPVDTQLQIADPNNIGSQLDPAAAYDRAGEIWDMSVDTGFELETIEDLFVVPESPIDELTALQRDVGFTLPRSQSPRDSLVKRGLKQSANQLILSDIERGRPSTAITKNIVGLGAALEGAAKIKSPEEFDKLSTWGKIAALPEMMLAARKGYYAPDARKISDAAEEALKIYRGSVDFDISAPVNAGEKAVDIGTGLGAFITRTALTRRVFPAGMNKYPNLLRALSFEMANTDGKPGEVLPWLLLLVYLEVCRE